MIVIKQTIPNSFDVTTETKTLSITNSESLIDYICDHLEIENPRIKLRKILEDFLSDL